MNYKLLGTRVKEQRVKKSLTQEQLAELCNISASYIGIIERGDKKLSVETLVKIATALNVSTDYLLADSIDISPEIRMKEILTPVTNMKQKDMDLIADVIHTIASHLSKE